MLIPNDETSITAAIAAAKKFNEYTRRPDARPRSTEANAIYFQLIQAVERVLKFRLLASSTPVANTRYRAGSPRRIATRL